MPRVPSNIKRMDVAQLHKEIRKLENMRDKAFKKWHEWMNGAWGQDPKHPLPMKQAGREKYRRYLDLDAQVAMVRDELFSRFRFVRKRSVVKRPSRG